MTGVREREMNPAELITDRSESGARSAVELAVLEGRDPRWEELLEVADRAGPSEEHTRIDDDALEQLVCSGAARLAAQMCVWLDLVAELVVRRIWVDQGARTPGAWLSWAVGMSPTAARDHVRVALRLRELPRVREEFGTGRISYSKVRAITRVAVPETEDRLLEWSRVATGADMEQIVAGFRAAQRAKDPGRVQPARQVRLRARSDGTSEVIVRMPTEEAHALYAGVNRLVDLEDAERHEQTGDEADSAESLPVAATQVDERPRPARLADAVLQAIEAAVASGGSDTTGVDRHTLVVHVDGEDLEPAGSDTAAAEVVAETPHGIVPSMSRTVLRRLACEAGLVLVTTRRDGAPIDVGRRQRHLSTALRRALIDRDRTCRFPGCGARRHLHGHHIRHWADGGPTDLGNLVLLCSFHHRYIHEHDIDVRLRPAAAHEFRFPDGRRIARVRPLVGTGDRPPTAHPERHPSEGVDGEALRPEHWDGRYCLDTAVGVLQQQVEAVLPHTALDQAA